MKLTKEIKSTVVESNKVFETDENGDPTFNHPSKYYIINSLGQYVYYHCRDRDKAQKQCDEDYGSSKYLIRTSKQTGSSGKEYSAKGTTSRRGTGSWLKKTI